jgi:hypothetical protein
MQIHNSALFYVRMKADPTKFIFHFQFNTYHYCLECYIWDMIKYLRVS